MAFSNIEGDFICEACGKHFIKRQSFFAHKGSHSKKKKRVPWNKGLTKESDARVKKAGETYSQTQKGAKRNALSSEHKISISKSMSKAHQEGRAHNIGKSRWNSKQSYPESFFEKVIINEFSDKNYKTEFNVGVYSIDFAWPEKKLAIEIDGSQHLLEERKMKDDQKDKLLHQEG